MREETDISQEELERCNAIISNISKYYEDRIVGQKTFKIILISFLYCNGNILLESVPGLAKTTAAKILAKSVGGEFSRIQCTP